ncbi:MAG TPA: hypothetical protein DGP39_00255 [Verrucomicrobiales bacterium]|nr:hypothetical protein [Verrucomicrobiales bacterium]
MKWLGAAAMLLLAGCASPERVWFADGQAHARGTQGALQVRPIGGQPLLGDVRTEGGQLVFTPQFPLQTGQSYEAIFTDASGQMHRARHTLPITAPAPELLKIFPSGDAVPANHLKFYLHFSERMTRGTIFEHFRLIDLTTGKPVEEPFRETELWSNDGKRLTLWLHPGRQKTGVNLNVDLGPVLEPRHRYALEIAADWKSEAGVPLNAAGRKVFTTEPADRQQPAPNRWTVVPPTAGSRAPLVIIFDEPLDHALLHNMLTVLDAQDESVAGAIEVTRLETQWRFTPQSPWPAGRNRVRIGPELEDLAGNNLLRRFEVNLEQPGELIFAGPRYLEFRPR